MMAKTDVDAPPINYAIYVAKGLSCTTRVLTRRPSYQKAYEVLPPRKQAGPLTDAEIQSLIDREVGKVNMNDIVWRSKLVDTGEQAPLWELPMQVKASRLLAETLAQHPEVRSVANIGARVDTIAATLAPRNPGIQFVSVDFQPNLGELNSLLPKAPNWTFMPGYGLDLMKSGKLRADLYLMTSTSVLFNNVELDAYLDAICGSAKVLVLNEPWWPQIGLRGLRLRRPEEIPVDDPYCGGVYANYHHNYVAKLERRGWRVTLSRVIVGRQDYACLQLVAVAPSITPS